MHPSNPRKIPTLLALLLLAVIVGSTVLLADDAVILFSRATQRAETIQPEQVYIANTTDTSATLFWKTKQPITGTVRISLPSNEKKEFLDIRDSDGISKSYTLHYVEINGLPSGQSVNITILSGKQSFPEKPLQLTAPISKPPQVLPLYGDIPDEAVFEKNTGVVVATVGDSMPLSTFVDSKQ